MTHPNRPVIWVGIGCLLLSGCGRHNDQARLDQEKQDEAAEAKANKAFETVDHDVAQRLYGHPATQPATTTTTAAKSTNSGTAPQTTPKPQP